MIDPERSYKFQDEFDEKLKEYYYLIDNLNAPIYLAKLPVCWEMLN
jgi:hypothetical protein